MSNNIKPEELQKAIMEYLEDYVEDIEEDVEDTTNTVVKEAKQELVQKSPKSGIVRKTKYYKGWAIKMVVEQEKENIIAKLFGTRLTIS